MAIGTNITASSFRPFVVNRTDELGQNVWNKTYQSYAAPITQEYDLAARNYGSMLTNLSDEYNEAINTAYESYVASKRAAGASKYGTGDLINIGEAYRKAYDQSKKEYLSAYEQNVTNVLSGLTDVQTAYQEQLESIASSLSNQQETLATNYADFFNSQLDYLEYLRQQYPGIFDDSTSYFNKFAGDEFMTSGGTLNRDKLLRALATEENGELVLTEEAANFMQAIASVGDYYRAYGLHAGINDYEELLSFDKYLSETNSVLAEYMYANNGAVANDLYEQLGIKSPYDTGFLSDWLPENSYSDVDYQGDKIEYSTSGINADLFSWTGDNFKLSVDGKTYKVSTGNVVDDDRLTDVLNKLATGDPNQSPSLATSREWNTGSGGVQMYNDKLYIYTNKGWREIINRNVGSDGGADVLKNVWRSKATGKSVYETTNYKLDKVDYRGDYNRFNFDTEITVGGRTYTSGRVDKSVSDALDQKYADLDEDGSIVEYEGRFYAKVRIGGNIGQGKTKWIQIRNFKLD